MIYRNSDMHEFSFTINKKYWTTLSNRPTLGKDLGMSRALEDQAPQRPLDISDYLPREVNNGRSNRQKQLRTPDVSHAL